MRRVPEWLPEVLAWRNWRNRAQMGGAIPSGIDAFKLYNTPPTRMDLIVYESPALINGLLMTEITSARAYGDPNRKDRVERFFFGYRCGGCREVFLIREHTRSMEMLDRDIGHDCDPSDIRRAVRNAREMGRERNEHIVVGFNGRWWSDITDERM